MLAKNPLCIVWCIHSAIIKLCSRLGPTGESIPAYLHMMAELDVLFRSSAGQLLLALRPAHFQEPFCQPQDFQKHLTLHLRATCRWY